MLAYQCLFNIQQLGLLNESRNYTATQRLPKHNTYRSLVNDKRYSSNRLSGQEWSQETKSLFLLQEILSIIIGGLKIIKWYKKTCFYWWLLPGRSEKSSMHSLKPLASRRSLSCCRIATPMQKGKEEFPKSRVSHRWKILCRGNTSAEEMGQEMTYYECILTAAH